MEISIRPGVETTVEVVQRSLIFKEWASAFSSHEEVYVTVHGVDEWDDAIHALQVTVKTKDTPWPIHCMLRSETVDVQVSLTDGVRRCAVFVEQFRPAVGARVLSNVAGGIAPGEDIVRAAEREMCEELGFKTVPRFLSTMWLLVHPVAVSPGMLNERTYMLAARITMEPDELDACLQDLSGKRTGVVAEGEDIIVVVCPEDEARSRIAAETHPDAKTMLSLSLALL